MTWRTFNHVTISYSLVIDVCRPLMLLSYHGSTRPRKEEREYMLSSRRGWHWGQWHALVDISATTPVNVSNQAYRCLRWSPHISQRNVVQPQVQSLSQNEMFGFSFPARNMRTKPPFIMWLIYISGYPTALQNEYYSYETCSDRTIFVSSYFNVKPHSLSLFAYYILAGV